MTFEKWKSEQYKDQSTEEKMEFVEHLHDFPEYFKKAFEAGMKADVHTDNSKVIAELKAQIDQLVYLHNEDVNTIKLLNKQIEKMKRCEICKHYRWNHCTYVINISADCIQNKMKHFELMEIKENDEK